MPYKPMTPCRYPGCAALSAARYCPQHIDQMTRDTRPTAAQRGYNAEWRRIRDMVLMQEPYCSCGRPAAEVHHVIPLTQGGSHDLSNLRAICAGCHRRITRRESLAMRNS